MLLRRHRQKSRSGASATRRHVASPFASSARRQHVPSSAGSFSPSARRQGPAHQTSHRRGRQQLSHYLSALQSKRPRAFCEKKAAKNKLQFCCVAASRSGEVAPAAPSGMIALNDGPPVAGPVRATLRYTATSSTQGSGSRCGAEASVHMSSDWQAIHGCAWSVSRRLMPSRSKPQLRDGCCSQHPSCTEECSVGLRGVINWHSLGEKGRRSRSLKHLRRPWPGLRVRCQRQGPL